MLRYRLINPYFLTALVLCCAMVTGASAADKTMLKVDINASGDYRSVTAPGWEGWNISGSGTNGVISNTFSNGIKVAFVSPWYSGGSPTLEAYFAPYRGAFGGDMLEVASPAVNQGDIRCTISNLSPGSYTFKSYHNPPAFSPTLNNFMDVNDRVGTDPWVQRYDNFDQPTLVINESTVLANPVVLSFVITQPGLDYQADYITRYNPKSLTDPNVPTDWSRNVGICGFEVISHAIYAAYDPSPLPDSTIRYNTSYNLQWMTPDVYEAGAQYYDLYFTTDSAALANGATPAGALLVSHAVQSGSMAYACPTLVASANYYWRVDSYGMKDGAEYKTVGMVWHFNTNNLAPTLDLGPNQVTKQGRTVTLNAVSTDLDGLPSGTITYQWTDRNDPNSNASFSDRFGTTTSPFPASTPSVSFVLDPNDAHVGSGLACTFRCKVSDGALNTEKDIVVVVYNKSLTNCEVSKKLVNYQTAVRSKGDLNDDCVTDMKDLSIYVAQWLACKAVNNVCQ